MNHLPDPVTTYDARNQPRKIKMDDYSKRIAEDSNMDDKEYLVQFGEAAFKNINKIVDINDNTDSIPVNSAENKGALSRLGEFAKVNPEKIDFLFNEIPEHGTRSLRRGYYKLLYPLQVHWYEDEIEIWRANVLYSEGPDSKNIYKYACNIGPLFNAFGVAGNLTEGKVCYRERVEKISLFKEIINRTIYVSSVKVINYPYFNTTSKEVLWFVW